MKTLAELNEIRDKMKNANLNRKDVADNDVKIIVGMATCGIAAGARPVMTALLSEVQKRNLTNVIVSQTGCVGMCKFEPIIEVFIPNQPKVTYVKMTPEKAATVIAEHIVNNKVCSEFTIQAE